MAENQILLPPPQLSGDCSVEQSLYKRRSHRSFGQQELNLEQIGQLAWAAQGITGGDPRWRTAPSAGALHILELYVLLRSGAYHYRPADHKLCFHSQVNLSEIAASALNQRFIVQAPCVFALAADIGRTTRVYKEKGRLYACMDLGHAAQNVLLQATALGLAGTPVGAFDEMALRIALKLPADQEPLYLIPIGYPG